MNLRRVKQIEEIAFEILNKISDIKFPKIEVEAVAKYLGLAIVSHDFPDDISGVLVIDGEKTTIGFNKNNHEVRRRFTIAHEIGHYVLSHQRNGGVFVDNKNFSILFRDNNSSTGEFLQEREANAFAAALLMPEKLIRKEIENVIFDLCDDNIQSTILDLSTKFGVSSQAMTFRLSNLGIIGRSF